MCETRSTHGSDVKWTLLVSKSEVKEQCGGLRCRFDDIIKGDLKETRCDIVKWAVFHHLLSRTLSAVECQWRVKSTKLIFPPPNPTPQTKSTVTIISAFCLRKACFYVIIIIIICIIISCHRPFLLPVTSLEPAVIPTAQATSFTLQYFPYYVWCSKYSCLL